jgi:hypothetical protein
MPTCKEHVEAILAKANAEARVARIENREENVPIVKDVVDRICIVLAERIDALEEDVDMRLESLEDLTAEMDTPNATSQG